MAKSSRNSSNDLFKIRSALSNEHLVFADTLRDWRDPLLHGHDPVPALLCPRCITCKCKSLKDLQSNHHYHIHDPTCTEFHHGKKPRERRAISHDPSITILNTSFSPNIKSKSAEHTPIKKPRSKIPIRISTSSTSERSPITISINSKYRSNKKTKIPRLIVTKSLPTTPRDR